MRDNLEDKVIERFGNPISGEPNLIRLRSDFTVKAIIDFVKEEIDNAIAKQKKEILEVLDEEPKELNTVFQLLNCYEIDASEVKNGYTYIGSDEASRLANLIIERLKLRFNISPQKDENRD